MLACIELSACQIPDLDLNRSPNATGVFSARTCPLSRYNTNLETLDRRLVECFGSYPQLYGSSKQPTALFNILQQLNFHSAEPLDEPKLQEEISAHDRDVVSVYREHARCFFHGTMSCSHGLPEQAQTRTQLHCVETCSTSVKACRRDNLG